MAEHNRGCDYEMALPFGRFPAAAVLEELALHLPDGARIELVTPLGDEIVKHLESRGELSRGGFLRAPVAWVEHREHDSGIRALATVCNSQSVSELPVWFTVFDADGHPLLEAEDGNKALFLGASLPARFVTRVLESVNASSDGVESGSLRQPTGSAF